MSNKNKWNYGGYKECNDSDSTSNSYNKKFFDLKDSQQNRTSFCNMDFITNNTFHIDNIFSWIDGKIIKKVSKYKKRIIFFENILWETIYQKFNNTNFYYNGKIMINYEKYII